MANVKIPLDMGNGIKARNMDELKEHFDIKKVTGYFLDKKLHKWLADRYYDEELEAINDLDASDKNLPDNLCEIFGVVQDTSSVIVEEISKSNERLGFIREITDDDKLINQAERIARNQDELDKLVSVGEKKIYLLDGTFRINISYENVNYIGIKNVTAYIPSKEIVPFKQKNIVFTNIEFDEEYQLLKKSKSVGNRFVITNGQFLFSDKQGKLNLPEHDFNMFSSWSALTSAVMTPNTRKKKTVQVFFDENVHSPIVCLCAVGTICGAVDEDGVVYTWNTDKEVQVIENLHDAVQIEYGLDKYFVLDAYGNLYTVASGEKSAELYGDREEIRQLAVVSDVALGLTEDGRVIVIEKNTGDGRTNIPEDLPPIKKVTIGNDAVFALSEDGRIFAWGNRYCCQIPDNIPVIRDIGVPGDCTPVIDTYGNIILCGKKETIKKYDNELINMPKAKNPLKEMFNQIWFISDDNRVYAGKSIMTIKKRNAEEKVIEIYDENYPCNEPDICNSLLMNVDDVFSITGRGIIITGIAKNDFSGLDKKTLMIDNIEYKIVEVECFRKKISDVSANLKIGVVIGEIPMAKSIIKKGSQVFVK